MIHRTQFAAPARFAGALVLACGLAGAADAQFVEPDAVALQTFTGLPGETYGWAVADLADIDGDGVTDAISGAPSTPRTGRAPGATGCWSSPRRGGAG